MKLLLSYPTLNQDQRFGEPGAACRLISVSKHGAKGNFNHFISLKIENDSTFCYQPLHIYFKQLYKRNTKANVQ